MSNKKNVIITGAANGIGLGLSHYFATEGYNLVLIDKEEIAKFGEYNIDIDYYKLDITNFTKTQKYINEILNKKDKIDVLINNAGILKEGFLDVPLEDTNQLIETNLLAHFNITKQIAKQMQKQKSGYIFNVVSRDGLDARPKFGAYAMSKFGLMAFNESLYEEMIKYDVKVTALCPSVTDTRMAKDSEVDKHDRIPVQDIVNTVNFLLSTSPNTWIRQVYIDCKKALMGRIAP